MLGTIALKLDDRVLEQCLKVEKREWPSDNYPFTADNVPLVIKAQGRRVPFLGYRSIWLMWCVCRKKGLRKVKYWKIYLDTDGSCPFAYLGISCNL